MVVNSDPAARKLQQAPELQTQLDSMTREASTATVKEYTWMEVAEHNSKASSWVSFRGKVYDITRFIDKHPGGTQMILLMAGRDVTDVIPSYHPFSTAPIAVLEKYEIGRLVQPEHPYFKPDTGFYAEVSSRVKDYFKRNNLHPRDPARGIAILCGSTLCSILCFLFLSVYWTTFSFAPRLFIAFLLGAFQAIPLLHTMHDASHAAIGKSAGCWERVGELVLDWMHGACIKSWHHQHIVGHHLYTNVIGVDPDLPVKIDGDLRRVTEYQKWHPIYQLQHLYLLFLYGFLTLKFRVQDVTETLILKSNGSIRVNFEGYSVYLQQLACKSNWCFWRIVFPLYFYQVPLAQFLACFFITEFTTGYYLTFMFQVSHISPVAAFPTTTDSTTFDDEWAIAQMKTTVDYAHGSALVTFLTGALNYQVAHHLFPGISQYHFPAIAPIIKEVATKYNLEYLHVPSFREAFLLHLRQLKNMGLRPDIFKEHHH